MKKLAEEIDAEIPEGSGIDLDDGILPGCVWNGEGCLGEEIEGKREDSTFQV